MDDLICYCLGYTATDIEEDVRLSGRSTILEKIQQFPFYEQKRPPGKDSDGASKKARPEAYTFFLFVKKSKLSLLYRPLIQ